MVQFLPLGGFQPDGRPKLVCFLEKGKGKALEGLCQSGFLFQKGNVAHLTADCNFTQLQTEPTIFVRSTPKGQVSLYVHTDDFWGGYSHADALEEFLSDFATKGRPLPLKKVPLGVFAGILVQYNRDAGTLHLSQPHILERAAERFFGSGKSVLFASAPAVFDPKVPYGSNFALATDAEKPGMKEKPY